MQQLVVRLVVSLPNCCPASSCKEVGGACSRSYFRPRAGCCGELICWEAGHSLSSVPHLAAMGAVLGDHLVQQHAHGVDVRRA